MAEYILYLCTQLCSYHSENVKFIPRVQTSLKSFKNTPEFIKAPTTIQGHQHRETNHLLMWKNEWQQFRLSIMCGDQRHISQGCSTRCRNFNMIERRKTLKLFLRILEKLQSFWECSPSFTSHQNLPIISPIGWSRQHFLASFQKNSTHVLFVMQALRRIAYITKSQHVFLAM